MLTRDDLDGCHSIFLSLMSEHGAMDYVTDGVDARNACAEVVINRDTASGIDLDANPLKAKASEEGTAT